MDFDEIIITLLVSLTMIDVHNKEVLIEFFQRNALHKAAGTRSFFYCSRTHIFLRSLDSPKMLSLSKTWHKSLTMKQLISVSPAPFFLTTTVTYLDTG